MQFLTDGVQTVEILDLESRGIVVSLSGCFEANCCFSHDWGSITSECVAPPFPSKSNYTCSSWPV